MTSATTKPRAGEHTGSRTPLVDAIVKKFPHSGQLEELARNLEAERDLLRERERELVKALEKLVELGDHVPVFQLDDGKSTVKAVRLAGKFMGVMAAARALLAKHGR